MSITLEQALKIAEVLHEEGYSFSEAYPLARWSKNGWPSSNDRELFKLLDAVLSAKRLEDAYKKKNG